MYKDVCLISKMLPELGVTDKEKIRVKLNAISVFMMEEAASSPRMVENVKLGETVEPALL